MKYKLSIKEWTDFQTIIKINFEKPEEVSADFTEDKLLIELKEPWIFVSKLSCLKLGDATS